MKKAVFLIFLYFIFNSILIAQTSPTIAVLDFKSNGTPQFIGNAISDIITTELKTDKDVVVLERNQIDQILKERSYFENSGSDLNGAIKFGEILSVDRIIIGSVSKIGDTYTITGKIVEIKSGAVEYAESENCPEIDNIEAASRFLATKLLNRISRTYHELPPKEYRTKSKNNNTEISLSARYGTIWGFKIPRISTPKNGNEIKIKDQETTLTVIEGVLSNDFISYKGLSLRGLVKYSHSLEINADAENSTYDDGSTIHYLNSFAAENNSYRGMSLGAGIQYNFGYSGFSPFISADIILTKYWFNDTFTYDYRMFSQNSTTYAIDYQNYEIKFAQDSNVISTDLAIGFKTFLNHNFGLNFCIGAEIPLYGSQFDKFSIVKNNSDTDDGLIQTQYLDLENKIKYDKKDFVQPPMYFIQLGFFYRV